MLKLRHLRRPLHHGGRFLKRSAKRAAYLMRHGYLYTEERGNPDFPDEHFERHQRVYEFCAELAKGCGRVLDVGCGCGTGSEKLARTAAAVIGIDRSRMALRFARRRWRASRNLGFVQMDAELLDLEDSSFDMVVSNENIEHLPHVERHVREIARVLRSNGIYFVGTPEPSHTTQRNPFHEHEFPPEELCGLLERYFVEVQLMPQEGSLELYGRRVQAGKLTNRNSYFVVAAHPRNKLPLANRQTTGAKVVTT